MEFAAESTPSDAIGCLTTNMNALLENDRVPDERVSLNKEAFKHAFLDNLFYVQGKTPELATKTRELGRWLLTKSSMRRPVSGASSVGGR